VSSVIYFIALFLLLKYFGVVGAGMAYAILYFSWILIMTATYHMIIKKNK
jgi:O-antigen/teichoic acid export membrane protein